jgi:hypothetical protein
MRLNVPLRMRFIRTKFKTCISRLKAFGEDFSRLRRRATAKAVIAIGIIAINFWF